MSYTNSTQKLKNHIIIHYFFIMSVIIEKPLNRIRHLIKQFSPDLILISGVTLVEQWQSTYRKIQHRT